MAAAQKWRTEDWVAVYLGFFIIAAALIIFNQKFFDLGQVRSTFRWTTDSQISARAAGWTTALDSVIKDAEARGDKGKAVADSANALKAALAKNERKAVDSAAGALAKAGGRNTVAGSLGTEIRGHASASASKVFSGDNLMKGVTLGIAGLVIGAIGFARSVRS